MEDQNDEFLMSLVESVLDRPAGEREEFLRSRCDVEAVRMDVRARIAWDQRMGRFLLDPLVERAVSPRSICAGTMLADRFQVIREAGYGGMGVVYEAHDETLDRRVALKCAKPGHRDRLPPEVRAAREISHFNVCKVHDLHVASTDSGDMEFLSMEFIEGETPANRIHRKGPLPTAEAKDVARQICAGLAQAHLQGVVHGDLKSANILLAKSRDGGVRAVITDFGLAKFTRVDGSNLMSARGGTVDYMAPELLLGERATVASDLYALGVLFHTMLAGHPPERVSESRLKLEGPAPRKSATGGPEDTTVTMGPVIVEADWQRKIEDLPSPWKTVIGRCLEAKPRDRFRSSEEVAKALTPRRIFLKWSAAAAATVALGVGYWQWNSPPVGPPVRLVVLPFHLEGASLADTASISLDVADRLTGLRRNFAVISPREAQQNQVDTPEKAKAVLGGTHALQTTLSDSGGQIVAAAHLVDLQSGLDIGSLQGAYAHSDSATLAKALIGTVTAAFRLRSGSPRESVSDAAYPAYVRGLNLLVQDTRKAGEAIPYFDQAIALDPRSALPYAKLADAQVQRFRNGDGRQWLDAAEASVLKARSINPDSVPVLNESGQVDLLHGRYEEAIRALSRAVELDPDDASSWNLLAGAYEQSNRDEEAIATYGKALAAQPGRYLPSLNFGTFYLYRGQFPKAENLYRTVTVLAPALASGHMDLGLALEKQGRFVEAEKELLQALSLDKSPRLLMNIGAVYYEQELYTDALRYFKESEDLGSPSAALFRDLGDAYRHLSRPKEAAGAYRTARTLAQEEVTGNVRGASFRARLAILLALLGDPHSAEYELTQALAMEPEDVSVMRDAAKTYEVLRQPEKALAVLQKAPRYFLEELNRQPDLKELQQDPGFRKLLQNK